MAPNHDGAITVATVAIVVAALIALGLALVGWRGVVEGAGLPGDERRGIALAPGRGAPVVDSLRQDGAAMRAGLRVGDLIEAVAGRRVAGVAAAARALAAPTVDIRVRRGDKRFVIHLPPDRSMPLG